MRWRRSLNAALEKATGYRIVKGDRLLPKPPPPRRPRRPKRPLPGHYDDDARQVIRAVKPRTMTAPDKLFALILATRYVVDHGIPGAVVECGVWRGGSMQAVARTLLTRGVTDRDLHLFDTFEGMPAPTEKDRRHDGKAASELLETKPKTGLVWAIASLEDVQAGMAETDYPAERIHLHRGLVEDTIPTQAPEQIAILRLDTDWYASTRHELDHLYNRVPSGGVILIDDYGYWQGAQEAVDEFLARTGARLLLLPMASGRITVKP
jgi:O-methyltransferase